MLLVTLLVGEVINASTYRHVIDRIGSLSDPASGGYTPANSGLACGDYTPANSDPACGDYTPANSALARNETEDGESTGSNELEN
ncbi:hypothetical protein SLEP1_g24549 [Rubroshorea leprosula]|uniref:Uncharacterized protein n=1 Tax=Rubroshorea leprosula TaxID=152421 RepID=A0AAV5JG24_9ROSI|nr:hypothetical protein SLEP1_g24549 [Rubroshorea leprosula]